MILAFCEKNGEPCQRRSCLRVCLQLIDMKQNERAIKSVFVTLAMLAMCCLSGFCR